MHFTHVDNYSSREHRNRGNYPVQSPVRYTAGAYATKVSLFVNAHHIVLKLLLHWLSRFTFSRYQLELVSRREDPNPYYLVRQLCTQTT